MHIKILFCIISIFILDNLYSQQMVYDFHDKFTSNKNQWTLNTSDEYVSNISKETLNLKNFDYSQSYYFRPENEFIPKSAIYNIDISAKYDFEKGANNQGGGFRIISNEIIEDSGEYFSDVNLDIYFTQNKIIVYGSRPDDIMHIVDLPVELESNIFYNFYLKINNIEGKISILIENTLILEMELPIFNFNKVGLVVLPRSTMIVQSFNVKSFDGKLSTPNDLFNLKFVDKDGILQPVLRDKNILRNELATLIPKEVLNLSEVGLEYRNPSNVIPKLMQNEEVTDFHILAGKKDSNKCYKFDYNNIQISFCESSNNGLQHISEIFIEPNTKNLTYKIARLISNIYGLDIVDLSEGFYSLKSSSSQNVAMYVLPDGKIGYIY